ncbi:MAG: hypothetical protein RL258_1671 [Pseudomonadota bacterium]
MIYRLQLFFFLIFASLPAMAVEEPKYRVVVSDPPFEHRAYEGFVVAETILSGDFDSASRDGFRRIAGFIFGDNSAQSGGSRKLAMTAPVTVEPQKEGWRLHFVMPSTETLSTLPSPNNPAVRLRAMDPHQMAVVRFSGWTTQTAIQEQTKKLEQWMATQKLTPAGSPQVARYNDPFTMPWRRRNEIMIPVALK